MKSWIALSKIFYFEKENLQVSLVTSRGLEEDEEDVLVSWLVLWYAENNFQEHDSLTARLLKSQDFLRQIHWVAYSL